MTLTLEQITADFLQLGATNRLELIAHLADHLHTDLHDDIFPGIDAAAETLGRQMAREEGMDEDDADQWASDFSWDVAPSGSLETVSRAKASRAARIQHGLDWIERRRAMLNPKVAA